MAATGMVSPLCRPKFQEYFPPPPTWRCSFNVYFPHHHPPHPPKFHPSDYTASTPTSPPPPPRSNAPFSFPQNSFFKSFKWCLKSGKYDEALYFLELLVSFGHKPCKFRCTQLIKGLSSATKLAKAKRVMEILELHGTPNIFAYSALLKALCRFGYVGTALTFPTRMLRHNCPPDTVTYNILIGALCSNSRIADAFGLLLRMQQPTDGLCACEPTVITYTLLLEGLVGEGLFNEAMTLLEHMSTHGPKPDEFACIAVLRALCREGHVDLALQLLRKFRSSPSGTFPDAISYNMVLNEALELKRWEEAEVLLQEMVSSGGLIAPTVGTYNILIKTLCEDGMVEKAVAMLDGMEVRGLRPNCYTINPMIGGYCRQGRIDLAVGLLERVVAGGYLPSMAIYNILLSALCKKGKPLEAMEVLRELVAAGYKPTSDTYNALVGGLWACGERMMALELMEEMVRKGVKADDVTYNVLVSCLCRDGLVDEAMDLVDDMEPAGHLPTTITYNAVLLGLCRTGRLVEAIDVFVSNLMGRDGDASSGRMGRPNDSTYVILLEAIASAGFAAEALELADALVPFDLTLPQHSSRRRKGLVAFTSSSSSPSAT